MPGSAMAHEMVPHVVAFWNLGRLFGSAGSPISHALNAEDPAATASPDQVRRKVEVIAAVIDQLSARAGGPPLLLGTAEIETADLARRIAREVRSARLRSVDDLARDDTGFALDGLDLALLVDERVEVTGLRSHVLDRTFDTRDILEVELDVAGAGLVVLLNHWPSRLSADGAGQRIGAAHYTAGLLEQRVRFGYSQMWDDAAGRLSLPRTAELVRRARTPVLVMGDFNDEVFDPSLDVLRCTPEPREVVEDLRVHGRRLRDRFRGYSASKPRLLNPFWEFAGTGGSYYRSPRWRTYDQILLSRGLCDRFRGQGLRYLPGSAVVHDAAEVTLADGTVHDLTGRTGRPIAFDPRRARGCSDHFPVAVRLEVAT
jgi:hypothetical protein